MQSMVAAVHNRCAGRAEVSSRQDWSVEASWKFHNLIQPMNLYCIETLILDANILRDSILTRIENIRSAHPKPYTCTCPIFFLTTLCLSTLTGFRPSLRAHLRDNVESVFPGTEIIDEHETTQ